jgi:hypothetical protein
VQYTYRILGTPKTVGYVDFDALPLAALYGKTIVVSCVCSVGLRCCTAPMCWFASRVVVLAIGNVANSLCMVSLLLLS